MISLPPLIREDAYQWTGLPVAGVHWSRSAPYIRSIVQISKSCIDWSVRPASSKIAFQIIRWTGVYAASAGGAFLRGSSIPFGPPLNLSDAALGAAHRTICSALKVHRAHHYGLTVPLHAILQHSAHMAGQGVSASRTRNRQNLLWANLHT